MAKKIQVGVALEQIQLTSVHILRRRNSFGIPLG
jgi:hypothetical protein